jgi:hypothetical protein
MFRSALSSLSPTNDGIIAEIHTVCGPSRHALVKEVWLILSNRILLFKSFQRHRTTPKVFGSKYEPKARPRERLVSDLALRQLEPNALR